MKKKHKIFFERINVLKNWNRIKCQPNRINHHRMIYFSQIPIKVLVCHLTSSQVCLWSIFTQLQAFKQLFNRMSSFSIATRRKFLFFSRSYCSQDVYQLFLIQAKMIRFPKKTIQIFFVILQIVIAERDYCKSFRKYEAEMVSRPLNAQHFSFNNM